MHVPYRGGEVLQQGVLWCCVLFLCFPVSPALAEYCLVVDTAHRGPAIPETLYGIFFEDINHAADGGVYAELVRNRSFEHWDAAEGWILSGSEGVLLGIADALPLAPTNPHYLLISLPSSGGLAELVNEGYGGIPLEGGKEYICSFFVRAEDAFSGSCTVTLEDVFGERYAEGKVPGGISSGWEKHSLSLVPVKDVASARLVLRIEGKGKIALDMVSLFPRDTWKGRENGWRKDLVEALSDLQPGFLRFPGGCIVEGNSIANAYRWKKTIGDVVERPTQWNLWGYHQSFGLGFFEYFLLAEDLGAEPVPVLNAGISCQVRGAEFVPLEAMGEWVQDALDLVEYANGGEETFWGRKRMEDGRPEPFGLRYLAIGNENWGEEYFERFALFQKALKARFPEVQLILASGTSPNGFVFQRAWEWAKSHGVDVVDEHLYMPPSWFLSNTGRYDSYDRSGPKVMVGEYAAHTVGRRSNLEAALAEAAFMTGIERNADIVVMASYAPLFGRIGWLQWTPNLIFFDATRVVKTPSYYVQRMFSTNLGDWVLPSLLETRDEAGTPEPIRGCVGLGTWKTQAAFDFVRVLSRDGMVLFEDDFTGGRRWRRYRGIWEMRGGFLRQRSFGEDCRVYFGDGNLREYVFEARGKKIGGDEGFLLFFGVQSDDTYYVWNIGGFSNTVSVVEKTVNGVKMTLGECVPVAVVKDRIYDLRVEVSGRRIRCFLNEKLLHDVEDATGYRPLYHVASYDADTGDVILKVVNPFAESKEVAVRFAGNLVPSGRGKALVLSSRNPKDENSLAVPQEVPLTGLSASFLYTFPPFSVTVLRIATSEGRKD